MLMVHKTEASRGCACAAAAHQRALDIQVFNPNFTFSTIYFTPHICTYIFTCIQPTYTSLYHILYTLYTIYYIPHVFNPPSTSLYLDMHSMQVFNPPYTKLYFSVHILNSLICRQVFDALHNKHNGELVCVVVSMYYMMRCQPSDLKPKNLGQLLQGLDASDTHQSSVQQENLCRFVQKAKM